jgi:hypothetical protein
MNPATRSIPLDVLPEHLLTLAHEPILNVLLVALDVVDWLPILRRGGVVMRMRMTPVRVGVSMRVRVRAVTLAAATAAARARMLTRACAMWGRFCCHNRRVVDVHGIISIRD